MLTTWPAVLLCTVLICVQLYAWGYTYVENLTWVWLAANNSVMRLPSTYCRRSHLTLLMFRKEGKHRSACILLGSWGSVTCARVVVRVDPSCHYKRWLAYSHHS